MTYVRKCASANSSPLTSALSPLIAESLFRLAMMPVRSPRQSVWLISEFQDTVGVVRLQDAADDSRTARKRIRKDFMHKYNLFLEQSLRIMK